jgi:hypothetical protein
VPIRNLFVPDSLRYEGVRPINIWLLRVLYLLMAVFVAPEALRTLMTHEGPWQHVTAVAYCVWATYPTLAVLGLLNPLRMLPIMLFTIGYKTLWLIFVAYPMWRAGTLAGSPAEEMANIFLWTPVAIIAVPWVYVVRNYVMRPGRVRVEVV